MPGSTEEHDQDSLASLESWEEELGAVELLGDVGLPEGTHSTTNPLGLVLPGSSLTTLGKHRALLMEEYRRLGGAYCQHSNPRTGESWCMPNGERAKISAYRWAAGKNAGSASIAKQAALFCAKCWEEREFLGFCPNGHDLAFYGVDAQERCCECTRQMRKWSSEVSEDIREFPRGGGARGLMVGRGANGDWALPHLEKILRERGLSYRWLANVVGLSPSSAGRIATRMQRIKPEMLEKLCEALCVQRRELTGEDEEA